MKKLISFLILILVISCFQKKETLMIDENNFSGALKGKEINLYTLRNEKGIVAQITNLGGRVVSLLVPDKKGQMRDIVLGYKTLEGFQNSNEVYFGALIGRYGNRINKGRFDLKGKEYKLPPNDGHNHLHGGPQGFHIVIWNPKKIDEQTLRLTYLSEDGEMGYPGNLKVEVIYKLTNDNQLKINYQAKTDKTTIINLTHHSFFNLNGAGNGKITDHILQINADKFTPINSSLIPTGQIQEVQDTPFDFTKPTAIGKKINNEHQQLKYGKGYDHNWVLNDWNGQNRQVASIYSPSSGIKMEVFTNEPGMQFYSGNFLDGSDTGKQGKVYKYRTAFCLETQHFPDGPNHDNFPSTVLKPGEKYYSTCSYKFSIAE